MKLKSIFLVAVAIIMASCSSGVPNKSIFKSLSSKEIERGVKVDPSFEEFYDGITEIMFLIPDAPKERYKNLTYKNTFEAYRIRKDINHLSKYFKNWDKEWEDKYERDFEKLDSLLNYWDTYVKQNPPEKFAKVELVGISRGWDSYDANFKITSLCDDLESVFFKFNFSQKNDPKKSASKECSAYFYNSLNSSESGVDSEYISSDKLNSLNEVSLDGFLQQYDYSIEYLGVRCGGHSYGRRSDNNIPSSVKFYWENTDSTRVLLKKEDIIKCEIDENYVSKIQYRKDKAREWLDEKYPQEMEFLDEIL